MNLLATMVWIIRHQFGRRNLTNLHRVELALTLEPLIAEKGKENQVVRKGGQAGSTFQKSGKLEKIETDKELAKAAKLLEKSPSLISDLLSIKVEY